MRPRVHRGGEELQELTPEQERALSQWLAWREYRRRVRPFRRTFRGIIARKEAERLFMSQARARQLELEAVDV